MRGVKTGRNIQTTDSESARARKRAAFLANIRQASQAGLARTHTEAPRRKRPTVVEVEVRPEPRRETVPTVPKPRRETVPTVARPRRETVHAVEQPKTAPRLFRDEALKHRLAYEEGRGLVRVSPPWTWALLWVVVSAVVAAVAASFVGEVEVTGRGRGIARPTAGVRVLTTQLGGTIARVEARSGERVKSGATLLHIESPSVQAQLLEADRELEALRTKFSAVSSQQDQHYAEQIENLKARAKRAEDQIASLRSSASHFERRVEADLGLLKKGLVSDMAVAESRDALAQAQRQLSGAEQALDQTRQELASLEGRREEELWNREQLLASAQNKRDALALVLAQGVVQAPEDGTVESLLARAGEVVQAGQVVGKLVPIDSPLQVVSFLAERDRAFAKPGDEVELELDQLPHAQYGTLRARVARIGDDLASPAEIRDALGEDQKIGPSYRVELEITDASAAEAAHVKLRTGSLMNVRFTLRRQRVVTLVLKPLQRWFR
ncbi:MAG TPA: HlyD family efflux transporter periplasmic adaptor subunit [Anaeromyxobacter sp.]|nr:HlyD family efflux transporter periplasmic adaptor subunit [Anaeromyxobacter sp.]